MNNANSAQGCALPKWALALLFAAPLAKRGAGVEAAPRGYAHVRPVSLNAGDADSLGARVVAFARAQQGRQVGNGECTDLADQALLNIGARSASSYDPTMQNENYTWGRQVRLGDARPGDILQFRGFNIVTTVSSRGYGAAEGTMFDQRNHHTAIVEQNLGNVLVVLEQNVPPLGRVVQRTRVPIASMTYDGEPDGSAPGWATTTVQVGGTIAVYRPQRAQVASQ